MRTTFLALLLAGIATGQTGTVKVKPCDTVKTYPAGDGCNTCRDECGLVSCTLAYCGKIAEGIVTIEPPVKPEAMDVPAVLEVTPDDGLWWNVEGTGPNDVQVKGEQRRWICRDKRRVLLTSEDGKKHCVLFPQQEPSKITQQSQPK